MTLLWILIILLIFWCSHLDKELRKVKKALKASNINHADAIKKLCQKLEIEPPPLVGAKIRSLAELSGCISKPL